MSPSTPCIGICRLDTRGICVGCGRTIQQIAAWAQMPESERLRIMATLPTNPTASAGDGSQPAHMVGERKRLRIVSLLPAATEMVFALGLGDELVGVSHECDFPPIVRGRPNVVRPALALEHMAQREIDAAVSQRLAIGKSLYEIDEQLLQRLRADLILTQDLCQVCAPSGKELSLALESLSPRPEVLALTPHTLADIFADLRNLAVATGRVAVAEQVVAGWRQRLASVKAAVPPDASRTRIVFMEWVDPIYCAGHWVPEMIALAGGVDLLARAGRDSVRVAWDEVRQLDPQLLIIAPCGFGLEPACAQLPLLMALPGWSNLAAVRGGQVFCVDANAYFARPGPRLVEGTELLAHLIHPELFEWSGPGDAFRRCG